MDAKATLRVTACYYNFVNIESMRSTALVRGSQRVAGQFRSLEMLAQRYMAAN